MADERRSEQKIWDGTLSGEDFMLASKEFLKLWNNHESSNYQWSWRECSHSSARGYLIMEDVVLTLTVDDDDDDDQEAQENDAEDEDHSPDTATLTSFAKQPSRCTYHVIYNESYKVPNIFFRVYHSDGRPMNWFDVQTSLPSQFAQQIGENKWTFLTQEEHPYLHRPWFTLHPCGTSSVMALIFSDRMKMTSRDDTEDQNNQSSNFQQLPRPDRDHSRAVDYRPTVADPRRGQVANFSRDYLLGWLSFVGPVVRLPITLDLFKSVI